MYSFSLRLLAQYQSTGTLPPPELVLGYWYVPEVYNFSYRFSQLKLKLHRHSRGRRCPAPWIEMDWVPANLPNNTYDYAGHASYYEPGK